MSYLILPTELCRYVLLYKHPRGYMLIDYPVQAEPYDILPPSERQGRDLRGKKKPVDGSPYTPYTVVRAYPKYSVPL